MKNTTTVLLLAACALSAQMYVSCTSNPTATEESKDTTAVTGANLLNDDALISRGDYLVNGMGCTDCHSPKKFTEHGPVPDMDLFLSGHPAESKLPPAFPDAVKAGWVLFGPDFTSCVGPWGTSFSANLTPDTATGTGAWTIDNFMLAIREGKFHGLPAGRSLLPPMPWEVIKNLTDDDLKAIFAYLRTIKPIHNPVPAPIPPTGA
jgi:hypothetical protein